LSGPFLSFWRISVTTRLSLLAAILIAVALPWCTGRTTSSADAVAQEFLAPRPAPLGAHFVGAGSCSASACHNANFAHGQVGSEFTLWATRDPHAKAYEALFDARSLRIQKNLGRTAKAHEDRRCLQCHVAPEFDEQVEKQVPYFRTDGVSCESCHGPAGKWLTTHYAEAWQAKTPAQKQSLGMKDTQSIVGRAQLCATCHVGTPGMDVDHDLIAAGHPRLTFEFTAFHAGMPRHWPDAKDRDPAKSVRGRTDFEYRAWLAGQLVTAHASLELLADRAGDVKKPWPEFAEHDCAACHYDLQASSKRPLRPGKRGAVPWSGWSLAMTPRALQAVGSSGEALGDLRKELDRGWSDRQAIAQKARRASDTIKPLLERIDKAEEPAHVLHEILVHDNRRAQRSWEDTAQVALALAAMRKAEIDRMTPLPGSYSLAIQELSRRLPFPSNYDKRDSFDPLAVRTRLIEFKKQEGR
jgi:hypothetical protein